MRPHIVSHRNRMEGDMTSILPTLLKGVYRLRDRKMKMPFEMVHAIKNDNEAFWGRTVRERMVIKA